LNKAAVFVLLPLGISLFAASNPTAAIDKDIKKTQSQIAQKGKEFTRLSSSIDDAAKDIIEEQNRIKSLDAQITALEADVAKLSEEHKQKNSEIQSIEEQKKKLENEKEELEKKLVAILAKDLSASLVLSETEPSGEDDIVKAQLSKTLSKAVSGYTAKLKAEYMVRQKMIAELETRIKHIKNSMSALEQKKVKLAQTKEERIKTIAKIQKQVEMYKAKLEKLAKEQQQARATLEQLNILKRQKLAEAAKAKPAPKVVQKAPGDKLTSDINIDNVELSSDVKMMGSSYQATKSARYTGRKVPAPLEGFRVIKQFGPYIDPIYKIRIHNDSVTLRSNSSDVMVKNIMDGKIVFAKQVAALGNVVIVQHDGNLHSIYAHLTKIAPTVQAGKKIEQGAIVGRIDKELTFEITKEDVPINPMDVIIAD
jgi:septal ring factor EnvC (AmiA/AmiB activator)